MTSVAVAAAVDGRSLYKKIFGASVAYSLVVFSPIATGILLLPIYTRFLQPSDYGALELLEAARSVLAMIIGARFTDSLFYFYGRATTESEKQSCVRTVVFGSLFLAGFTAILGYVCAPAITAFVFKRTALTPELRIVSLTLALSLPFEAVMAWIRALDDRNRYLGVSLLRLAVTAVFTTVSIVVLGMKVRGVLASALLANAVFLPYLLGHFFRHSSGRVLLSQLTQQLRFGFLLTATGLSTFVINFGDRFFLQRYVSLSMLGMYGLAYKCGMVVSIAQSAFGIYWASQVYTIVKGDLGLQRFSRIHTYLLLTLSYLAVLVSAAAPILFVTAISPQYYPAVTFVPWIALVYVLRGHCDYVRSILYVEGRPATDTRINAVSALVCVGLYIALIPPLGCTGAIIATAAAFLVAAASTWMAALRTRPYRVEMRRSFGITITALAAIALCILFRGAEIPLRSAACVVAAVGFPAAIYLWVLTPDERFVARSVPGTLARRMHVL